MSNEEETIRWPITLNGEELLARLSALRKSAQLRGVTPLADFFAHVENMTPAKVACAVVAAMEWLDSRPEHAEWGPKLSIVALNLKNLK